VAQAAAEHVEALTGQLIRSREVLFAIESLFNARREITRTEFRDFVASTLRRHQEIVDLRLPGLDGFETARQLSAQIEGRLRVVATPASVLDGEQERSLADGCGRSPSTRSVRSWQKFRRR
jgi:CheY-like chemotaxis protein